MLIVFVLLLAVVAFFGIRSLRENQVRKSIEPYAQVYAPHMYVNDLPISGLTPQQAFDSLHAAMQQRINSWTLAVNYQGHTYTNLNYSVLGLSDASEELYQLLTQAWQHTRSGSIYDRKAAIDALTEQAPYKAYTSTQELQNDRLSQLITQIAGFVDAQPTDAALLSFHPDESEPFSFIPDRPGAKLDVQAAIADIMNMAASGQSGSYELQPQMIPPRLTLSELKQSYSLRSSIVTAIASDSDEKRNHNIRLSLSKFNGSVIKPGQTFSFNNTVGPRTLQAGFAEALEYAYGELEIGVGGGVCQASTTLYQAAVTGGLSIIKRYPHSGPVSYTQLGQDATVFWSRDRNIDLQFRNTTASNIYITAQVRAQRNNARRLETVINIYGESLGEGVSYRLRSEVVQVIPAPEEKKYETDHTGLIVTYTDEEKRKTKAVEGQIIETFLEKLQNGVVVEQPKLINRDTFNAKPAVYWRGANKR